MTDEAKKDYRDTVFLPKTDFPMKAGLADAEPKWLARWQGLDLYRRLRDARKGAMKFILHDGPPYANGDMHIGHALNHILKDMVVRTQTLAGKDAPYVPGWDCHGLPIEWKVEEEYRKKGRNKDEVDPKAFRAECRAYAQHWVDRQREQLKRLGIGGDWDNPYLTMDFEAEATIVAELMKFAESGQLYRGAKPVMWSPVEKTALAEAEIEYEDIVSTQVDVAFEITDAPKCRAIQRLIADGESVLAVIWTTTPWTIPVNRALAYGPEIEYALLELPTLQDTLIRHGQSVPEMEHGPFLLVATSLIEDVRERIAPNLFDTQIRIVGSDLAGAAAKHPWHHLGGFFAEPRPLLAGDFVTTDTGTGIVHMAPDHGEDDFWLCKAHGIEPKFVVGPDGTYQPDWPVVGGAHVYKVNAPDGSICEALSERGALLAASADYKHSYPHSWRSKAKVIFRCTPQWFVPMDAGTPTLRDKALTAIDNTRWVPERGKNRIGSMVAGRPDWVLSRQRAWGVPITLFVNAATGEYLRDPEVNARIVAAVKAEGVDGWTGTDAQALLGAKYDAGDFERVTDILDVWFDSGCTHVFVLESGRWPDLRWPADVYLEGSDQHRGWFQSSLLQSCATRGRAPYDTVITHGFTMAADGRKMSKSLGNTIDPNKVIGESGADILRLWAINVDWQEDHRIGPEIMKGMTDAYRKIRNTFRYLLGALDGFEESERIAAADMPELERWVLHRLAEIDSELRQCVNDYDFTRYVTLLQTFCVHDLSAFYFDVRKDSLYCDAPTAAKRRACRTVLDILFHALTRWFAPVLVFTAEEVWQSRFPSDDGSVHLLDWPEIDHAWHDAGLCARWEMLRNVRANVTEAIEPLRQGKIIRSSNEAEVVVPVFDGAESVDFAELCIVADVAFTDGEGAISIIKTEAAKCARCWRHTGDVDPASELCKRCADVVA